MSLTVKAFLYRRSWKEEPLEIRRFSLDQDVSTSYSYLVQKIAQVFPSVPEEDIVLSWADAEGDHITISSDDELLEALDQFDGSIFKVHLRKREKPRSFYCQQPMYCTPMCHPSQHTQSKHRGDEKMEGDDEAEQQTPSSGADTEQRQQQKEGPQQGQSQQRAGPHHIGVVCDGCGCGIYGIRFKCLVCPDYDLCSSCEKQGKHVDHNMVTINKPHTYYPWGFHGRRFGGPWQGRGGHCGGRGGGRSGAPWMSPYFLQHLLGGGQFGQGGVPQGCCGQQPPQEKSQPQAKPEEMETEQNGSGEDAQLEQEQRQSYLQDVGEAVSSFLRPFGVKVDVGVVDEDKTKKEGTDAKPTPPASSDVPSGYEGNTLYPTLDSAATAPTTQQQLTEAEVDSVEVAVTKLRGMGFDNEGGWLTELVRAKGGDIEKVLDALHPSQSD